MAEVVADINLGAVPEGVIVCREHRRHG
jgi:hypothetical protein